MGNYSLTAAADGDLEALYEYSILHYGLGQAQSYYQNLMRRFEDIAENPRQWQAVDHIRSGYRRCVCGQHSIYYHIKDNDDFVIVRILNQQDVTSLLSL